VRSIWSPTLRSTTPATKTCPLTPASKDCSPEAPSRRGPRLSEGWGTRNLVGVGRRPYCQLSSAVTSPLVQIHSIFW
jgi:hypothetical protein